jgi:hypothetical protein
MSQDALRNATAALLRSYETEGELDPMVERNNAIAKQTWAKSVDHIVFHEDNFKHEKFLRDKSEIELTFVNVQKAFDFGARATNISDSNPSTLCPPNEEALKFGVGYRSMCWFWYAGLLQFVQDYHWLLRIDADCTLEVAGDDWLKGLQPHSRFAIMSDIGMDAPFVTQGMQELFTNLAIELGLKPFPKEWRSPYTNVMALDVRHLRHDQTMHHVFKAVNATRCIWLNRWGDLPLWGATIQLLDAPVSHIHNFNYYHGSHDNHIKVGEDGRRI